MITNKKSTILLILKVLEEYSDENHYLTLKEIIDKIYSLYGVELERKSVSYSLNLLEELNYDINKLPKGGYALLSRNFDINEVRFISDAIISSKAINYKQARSLINKINSCLSVYQRREYGSIYNNYDIFRSDNKELFLTLELIEEAKRLKKRISFVYQTYDKNGKLVEKLNGFRYIVSPYYSINSNGKYFLICNYREKYRAIQWFRLDYIKKVKIEGERPIKPINSLKGIDRFKIDEYINNNIYLLEGDVINAKIEIEDENVITCIKDWFGKNAKIYNDNENKLIADIKCNETALFYWHMQYSQNLKILSPESLKEKVIQEAERILSKYGKL